MTAQGRRIPHPVIPHEAVILREIAESTTESQGAILDSATVLAHRAE